MNLDRIVNDIILEAFLKGKENKYEYITPEMLLLVILETEKIKEFLIEKEINIEEMINEIYEEIKENATFVQSEEESPKESYQFNMLISYAASMALGSGRDSIGLEHIISAFYNLQESFAKYILEKNEIKKRDILMFLIENNKEDIEFIENEEEEEEDYQTKKSKKRNIDKFSIELTSKAKEGKLDPVIGRDEEIKRTIQILLRRNKNNPIHIGEAGVGKTSIVRGLANLIVKGDVPEKLLNSKIFSLDIGGMIAGAKYRGDFEERIKSVLKDIEKYENPIVYIDEIHTIVGAGALGNNSLDASNIFKPYLQEGNIRFIGSTTFDEYKKYFDKDKALQRRFQTIEIKEPSEEETFNILKGLKEKFESYHNVKYTDEALREAINLTNKFINDRFLPDKAIDIIDEAGALSQMKEEIGTITKREIEDTVSKIVQIPKEVVEKDELTRVRGLKDALKNKIYGQDEAIENLVKSINMSKAGLKDHNKPVASLLFVGQTGVGKTEIAKVLSEEMNLKLLRFDMSEYGEKHSAAKLIGTPPGYVGYEEGGLLTDAIFKNPNSVLLLDEIEKAHSDVFDTLLQVMDYASLTDNKGKRVSFRNVIIIMTSNAGARDIGKPLVGFLEREIKSESVFEEVKRVFSPEFRNRLDEIIKFNSINEEVGKLICIKELNKLEEKVKNKNINLIMCKDSLIEGILEKAKIKEFGGRDIVKVIDREIKPKLAEKILFSKENKNISLYYKDDFIIE
ncbi:AAA family ATPase [Clostridium thermobutyricum]|uniref:AAA family ATPase n=1 Tax=Clostridium thermobutyricum TaxID=29372 RepID=UPI0029439CA1|nr:AAA family ATPase [Clostridium thermobutyricum]